MRKLLIALLLVTLVAVVLATPVMAQAPKTVEVPPVAETGADNANPNTPDGIAPDLEPIKKLPTPGGGPGAP